jgi:hypothetical protein
MSGRKISAIRLTNTKYIAYNAREEDIGVK